MAKGFKLKFRMFCGLIPTFVEVTGEKLVGGLFAPVPTLNRIKTNWHSFCVILQFSHALDGLFSVLSGLHGHKPKCAFC